MNKRKTIISFILLAIVLTAAVFYWQNLRGVWPAILPPARPESPRTVTPELPAPVNTTGLPLTLPPGFSISIFAADLGKPRVMTRDPAGNLLVSVTSAGKVVALPDRNADGRADEERTVVSGLTKPHGMAWRCRETCTLYIAESDAVAIYDYDRQTMRASNRRKIIDLPNTDGHFTRTITFLPSPNEDELVISVGSSCNVCNEDDQRRAKILIAGHDGSNLRTFASGLRNAVFMTLHPVTGNVWVTEMGRDMLGDDLPPDEINVVEEGRDYGWPVCYGKNVHDTDFDPRGSSDACRDKEPSYVDIPAHSAPLGLAFVPEEGWPEDWWHDLIVAYHGSWNRSVPTGYKLVRLKLDAEGNYDGTEDFITGWLQGSRAVGRPADVLIEPGGVMYVSDDHAGVIYRITYRSTIQNEDRAPARPVTDSGCVVTGCSGQVCAAESVITTCEFFPEYACYRTARCERQPDGHCDWTRTDDLARCQREAS